MKAKFFSSFIGLILFANLQLSAQKRVTVEAVNDDISYYLDLKAVAYIFGESSNLEDFEYRLNDMENNLSNLDLNNDGNIDYLRVIEITENKVHLVAIQAVLDRDVYQDIATIVVERDRYRRTSIQVIGDSYLYGDNYIIEPMYYRTPSIFSWFWRPRYTCWTSPYYWGYYPHYYSHRHPIEINLYIRHINNSIYNHNHYRYAETRRYNDYDRLHSSVRRNDYGTRYPEKKFNSRNNDIKNKSSFEGRRGDNNRGNQVRSEINNERLNANPSRNSQGTVRNNSSTNNRIGTRTQNSTNTNSPRTRELNTGVSNENRRLNNNNTQQNSSSRNGVNTINKPSNSEVNRRPNVVRPTNSTQPVPKRKIQNNNTNQRTPVVRTEVPKVRVERNNSLNNTSRQAPVKTERKVQTIEKTIDSNNSRR